MAEYTVSNPAINAVVFGVAIATDAEVDAAVARADAAYRSWRRIAITERAAYLAAVAREYRAELDSRLPTDLANRSELAHAWRQLDRHLNQFTNAALTAA